MSSSSGAEKSSGGGGTSTKSAMTTLGYFRAAREWVTPVLTKSAFLEKGVLTPDEFVRAGDELCYRCPTWSWEGGDPAKAKSYLPPHKQYLVTRNVPCPTRVAALEQQVLKLKGLGLDNNNADDDDDEWLISTLETIKDSDADNDDNLADDFDILDETGEIVNSSSAPTPVQVEQERLENEGGQTNDENNKKNNNEEDEYADMDDFEDDNIMQDDVAVAAPSPATADKATSNNLLKVRTYDLSITYDKYFQTPRVWLMGKSATGQPLTGDEMLQDVMTDYARKTVSIEAHPHTAGPHASIQPCKHSNVMKTIVQNLIKASDKNTDQAATSSTGPSIEMYLFIFLKFVSSIIPTINYDFTMDVAADTRK